jgi:hypothetical protein
MSIIIANGNGNVVNYILIVASNDEDAWNNGQTGNATHIFIFYLVSVDNRRPFSMSLRLRGVSCSRIFSIRF